MLETTSRMIWRLAPGGETWTLRPAELTLDVLTLGTYPLEMEIISFGASDKMYSPFFFNYFLDYHNYGFESWLKPTHVCVLYWPQFL